MGERSTANAVAVALALLVLLLALWRFVVDRNYSQLVVGPTLALALLGAGWVFTDAKKLGIPAEFALLLVGLPFVPTALDFIVGTAVGFSPAVGALLSSPGLLVLGFAAYLITRELHLRRAT